MWHFKHSAADLADWWDKNATPDPGQVILDKMERDGDARVDQDLSDFVDAHPHLWVIAATVQTGLDIGRMTHHALNMNARLHDLTNMYVDVLRFGEGAAEYKETGKLAPLIQDALRGASIASAAGEVAQAGRPLLGKLIGVYADSGGMMCVPISLQNAARLTGQRIMLSVRVKTSGIKGISCDSKEVT